MCEGIDPRKYSRGKVFIADEGAEEPEENIRETFTKLSASTIAKLIEDEPDSFGLHIFQSSNRTHENRCFGLEK
jgi:hypothetical protein